MRSPSLKIGANYTLNEYLEGAGIKKAFDGSEADFSGISTEARLFISAVLHKAWIKVEEKGTEAAAATAVVIASMVAPVFPPVVFRADHPFLYLIVDKETGMTMFFGRLTSPNG